MFFQDKVVWVTGASSGIGEGLVYALAKEGSKLILSARRVEELERVRARCLEIGVGSEGAKESEGKGATSAPYILPMDVTDLEGMTAKAAEANAAFGGIDILVNNAGVGFRGYVIDTDIAVQQRVMQVNYFGTIALTKAVLPYMILKNSGHIVVVSSLAGKLPVPGRSAYCASKHALHGFFDALRGEVFKDNIKVTLVCPGWVQTQISENALLYDGTRRGGTSDKEHSEAMTPEESARHILYAIRKGKDEYDYGGKERFVVPVRRFFPWVYARAIRRVRLSS